MSWNRWVRQTHRWVSILFTIAVIVSGIAVIKGKYNAKLGLVAVFFLALMFVTGMYLFVLPYVGKRRGRQRVE